MAAVIVEDNQIQRSIGIGVRMLGSRNSFSIQPAAMESEHSIASDGEKSAESSYEEIFGSSLESPTSTSSENRLQIASQSDTALEQASHATGMKLILIVFSLALTIFCVAVDNTSQSSMTQLQVHVIR